jgi:hypothetical protein
MAEVFDFAVDPVTMDMVIKNGDFMVEESTLTHQKCLLLAEKGDYRQFPTVGVGLTNYLLDDGDTDKLTSEIQTEFTRDGMEIDKLIVQGSLIDVEAEYGEEN